MAIIEVNNLVKTYKTIEKEDGLLGYFKNLVKPKYNEFTAVNKINFNIEEGELVGYIGENGAGKSTTIKNAYWLINSNIWKCISKRNCTKRKRIQNNKKYRCCIWTEDTTMVGFTCYRIF